MKVLLFVFVVCMNIIDDGYQKYWRHSISFYIYIQKEANNIPWMKAHLFFI